MIDLYYWPTPNGHKITIFLEETGLEYRIVPVNIRKGEQFAPEFLKISPNNRMPAIVDTDGPGGKPFSLFESGAILLYLAREDRQVDAVRDPRALPGNRVADVPDGQRRPDARPGAAISATPRRRKFPTRSSATPTSRAACST